MKNFSFKTKKSSPHSWDNRSILRIIGAIVISVCLILLLRGVIGPVLSGAAMNVLGIRNYFQTSSAALPVYIRDRNELHAVINGLSEEVAAQSGNRSTIARLSRENEELRALMGNSDEERILAGVIARPPAVPYDLLVIDQGSDHGITEGALVYHEDNHVIGTISRVYGQSALVTLFSSAGAETTVFIYGPDIFAYAYGEGGGVIRISVPQGVQLTEGDPVVLASLNTGDMGVIERIVSLSTQPEQNAYFTYPVPIQSMHRVLVAKNVEEPKTFEELVPNIELIRERFRVEVPDRQNGIGSTTPTSTPAAGGVPTQI